MISLLLKELNHSQPLEILSATFDGINLQLVGQNWNFNTMSSWRISTDSLVVVGCEDEQAEEFIQNLEGKSILGMIVRDIRPIVDPVFIINNDMKLEIFSTTGGESWVMELPDVNLVFVAVPSSEDHQK